MANTHSANLVAASSQRLYAAHSATLTPSSFTFEAWIKPTSVTSRMDILLKDRTAGNASYLLTTGITSGKLSLYVQGTAGSANIDSTSNIVPNVWTHVAVTYDGTTAKIYLNGDVTPDNTATLSFAMDYTGTTDIFVGGNGQYYDGRLDDIRIWNTIRTGAQINANYMSELVGNESNLQAYWKLDNSLADSTSNGNTLTNTNSVTFVTDTFSFNTIQPATTSTGNGSGTSITFAHNVTGLNRLLWVGVLVDADKVSSVTYNGVAMTQMAKTSADGGAAYMYLYYLVAPDLGANNIVITLSSSSAYINGAGVLYTGAKQTGVPDAQVTNVTTGTTFSTTATVVASGSWLVGMFRNQNGAWTVGSNTALRKSFVASGDATIMVDSNGPRGDGSRSLAATCASADLTGIMASFAPVNPDIGFDTISSSANITGTNSATVAHTCTGTNRLLVVGVQITDSTTTTTGITYNSVALTKIAHKDTPNTSRRVELWYLVAPATGSNNIVVTLSGNPTNWFNVGAVSYTNVKQTGIPDASATASANSGITNTNLNVTTVATNTWLVGVLCNGAATNPVANSGTTLRNSLYNRTGNGYEMFSMDSNGTRTPAGTQGIGVTNTSGGYTVIVASIEVLSIQTLTLTADVRTYSLTGIDAVVGRLFTLVAALGTYVLTAFDATIRRTGWVNRPKTADPTFTARAKSAEPTFTARAKSSDPTWINRPKS